MKESDNTKGAGDVPFKAVGMGHFVGFTCAACNLKKSTAGRRMQWISRFLGRQWVCRDCVKDH